MEELPSRSPASPVIGSAEVLTREQTLARLRELEAWGVDLSLVRDNLTRTPSERVAQMYGVLRLAHAVQRAVRARNEQLSASQSAVQGRSTQQQ